VRQAWALPIRPVEVHPRLNGAPTTINTILPSDHVRRDFENRLNYDLFLLAGGRSAVKRRWYPEFCDSRFCRDRADARKAAPQHRAFVIDGVDLRSGDEIEVDLGSRGVLRDVTVGMESFAGHSAGVQADESVHAGDLTLQCSRGGLQIGTLDARHWLLHKHQPISWHIDGRPALKVARLTLVRIPTRPAGRHPGHGRSEQLPGQKYAAADGVVTFMLLLAFCSDDFVCNLGRSASAGGVCMLCLPWLFRHRTSRKAVRPFGLAAPDVNSDLYLEAIMDGLVQGATEGWMVTDPDGVRVRVLANLSLLIGDYKQVSKTGNLMGHMANVPCLLCSLTKSTEDGSRYATSTSSRDIALIQTTSRTLAVVGAVQDVLEEEKFMEPGGQVESADEEAMDMRVQSRSDSD